NQFTLRKIHGSSRRRPLRTHCHSEPLGEESRFAYFYFALLAILRFAQDDKSPPQPPFVHKRHGGLFFVYPNSEHVCVEKKIFPLCPQTFFFYYSRREKQTTGQPVSFG
ncbi:MAG: hypothetical protein ACI4K8_06825, partial [Candidatus Fimenecus sp.]